MVPPGLEPGSAAQEADVLSSYTMEPAQENYPMLEESCKGIIGHYVLDGDAGEYLYSSVASYGDACVAY